MSLIQKVDSHIEAHPIHTESKFEHLLKGVLPILQMAVPFFFFKPSWQSYLRAFIAAANEITPVNVLDDELPPPTDPNEQHGHDHTP